MKLQYLGTAAAEGVPSVFCNCTVCQEARIKKGRHIRTRSQALIDDTLLVDFNADTYAHSLRFDIDLSKLEHVIITHAHEDHYYPTELFNRQQGFCHGMKNETLTVHGSEDVENYAHKEWDALNGNPMRLENQNRVALAIETGPEKAKTLLAFLQDTKGGVGVNLDPANFTMVTGQDAVEAVYLLKDYIVHTHAKDGVMLDPEQDPTDVYHAFAVGGVDALNACKGFKEVPLGEGQVNWDKYIAALKEIGFDGFLTIERECGDDPAADIVLAVDFLRSKL